MSPTPAPLDALDRPARLARLAAERFDLIVVGGGIVGAGIAWDAARRGLAVALIEKGDFASGTSSKSSKLLHGGLRYLEQAEIGLVFESLAERNRLFGDAQHLARRLDFLFPIFRGGKDRGWMISAGLWIYDLLSHITFPRGPWHKRLRPAAALAAEPALRADGLQAAFRYVDGLTEDARLVIETLKSAAAEGALCLNHAEVTGFVVEGGRVRGVNVRDRLGPGGPDRPEDAGAPAGELTVRARRVFVAAGPWVDAVMRLDDPTARPRLRPTKGVHVVVPAFVREHAVVMRSVDPHERQPRVLFAIPWGGRTIVGTTDTDPAPSGAGAAEPGAPEGPGEAGAGEWAYLDRDVEASPAEVRYVLDAANATFGTRLTEADVIAAFAGWRPLIAPPQAGLSASKVSREAELFETPSGLLAIAGGKLTGYRAMACQAVDRVVASLRQEADAPATRPCEIEHLPLSGSELGERDLAAYVEEAAARPPAGLDVAAVRVLATRYGTNWPVLAALLEADARLASPLPGLVETDPRWLVEVAYAVRHEGAATPADFLMRRTRLQLLDGDQGLGALEAVTTTMAELFATAHGWSDDDRRAWAERAMAAYRAVVAHGRRTRGRVTTG